MFEKFAMESVMPSYAQLVEIIIRLGGIPHGWPVLRLKTKQNLKGDVGDGR